MRTSLPPDLVNVVLQRLAAAPAEPVAVRERMPVHVLYGGAHLYKRDAAAKLGRIAKKAFDDHAAGSPLFADAEVRERVGAKLAGQAVEAMCIDFEDGFGPRPDAEEDAEAVRAATELAATTSDGPVVGMRIKALAGPTARRAVRTLDLFVSTLAKEGSIPAGFAVTLPKVSRASEVTALAELLGGLEAANGIDHGRILVELMVETPRALFDESGRLAVASLVDAAGGRCTAVHLGAYDLLSSFGIGATEQRLDHPACDLARLLTNVALEGRDVPLYDGATTVLPVGGAEGVHRGWSMHAANVRRAIDLGIHQGWDLHPAQLPARYAALFDHFLSRRAELATRLASFVERATKATLHGQVFDDAATGQGLLVFFLRGLSCGALDDADLAATTLTKDELRSRSFAAIVAARSKHP